MNDFNRERKGDYVKCVCLCVYQLKTVHISTQDYCLFFQDGSKHCQKEAL